MKKKRLAAVAVAFVIILSCGFSAFALPGLGLGDLISIIDGIDLGAFPSYNETAWNNLSIDEKRSILEEPINALKGSPHLDDDFLNSSQAYDYYCSLIRAGNSADFITSPISTMYAEIMLERAGQADFGLGFYNGGGHSSGGFGGKFGDGTVADTLNDDFLDYIQNNPIPSDFKWVDFNTGNYIAPLFTNSSNYIGHNLYLFSSDGSTLFELAGHGTTVEHSHYNQDDINFYKNTIYTDLIIDHTTGDYSVNMEFGYDSSRILWTLTGTCPYFVNAPFVESDNSPTAVAVDENNNTINVNLNSDGVTYEGNTYNYNADNSVTIDGNTYNLYVDPSTVDNNYYNQFLENVFNNYNNYFTTSSTPFDGTDILSSLRSIFSSLESFRLSSYAQLKQIYTSVHDGFNSLRSSASNILKKLNTIISQLKSINKNFDELTEEQKKENELGWLDLIKKFQNKIGWSNLNESMSNIFVAFFGRRQFETSEGGVVSVSIESNNTVIASSMPSLSIEFMGVSYNLYSCVGFLGSGIETIKGFIRVFLWVGFIVSLFRSFPSIIGGVSSVQDHSNNVVVDRHTGEVKWGA